MHPSGKTKAPGQAAHPLGLAGAEIAGQGNDLAGQGGVPPSLAKRPGFFGTV